jgi:hypothetical protein
MIHSLATPAAAFDRLFPHDLLRDDDAGDRRGAPVRRKILDSLHDRQKANTLSDNATPPGH